MRRYLFLTFIAVVSIGAQALYYQDAGSGLWMDANNWDTGAIPTASDSAIFAQDGSVCNIGPGDVAEAQTVWITNGGSITTTLNMSGGTLTVNQVGGSFGRLSVGFKSVGSRGIMYMSGGQVDLLSGTEFHVGYQADGELHMTGGTINGSGLMYVGKQNWNGSAGEVHLDGGTITAPSLYAGERGIHADTSFDITGGTLILPGDKRVVIESYVLGTSYTTPGGLTLLPGDPNLQSNEAWMSGYGGHEFEDITGGATPTIIRGVLVKLDIVGGALSTVVTAIPEPATLMLLGLGGLAIIRKRK